MPTISSTTRSFHKREGSNHKSFGPTIEDGYFREEKQGNIPLIANRGMSDTTGASQMDK
jgi:hypothetical protein